jgi:hypothetical protein
MEVQGDHEGIEICHTCFFYEMVKGIRGIYMCILFGIYIYQFGKGWLVR